MLSTERHDHDGWPTPRVLPTSHSRALPSQEGRSPVDALLLAFVFCRMDDSVTIDELLALLSDAKPVDLALQGWLSPVGERPGQTHHLLSSSAGSGVESEQLTSLRLETPARSDVRARGGAAARVSPLPSAPEDLATQAAMPPKRRRSRKEKIAALRNHADNLALALRRIKVRAGIDVDARVARVPAADILSSTAEASSSSCLRLWRKIAMNQLERRRASELEHRMLHQAVALHTGRARRLQQLLVRRARQEVRGSRSDAPTGWMGARADSSSCCTLSCVLVVLPDLSCAAPAACDRPDFAPGRRADVCAPPSRAGRGVRLDRLDLSQRQDHELPRPGRLSSARGLGRDQWRVELRNVHIVPFDVKLVERAAWRSDGGDPDSSVRNLRFWVSLACMTSLRADTNVVVGPGKGNAHELLELLCASAWSLDHSPALRDPPIPRARPHRPDIKGVNATDPWGGYPEHSAYDHQERGRDRHRADERH